MLVILLLQRPGTIAQQAFTFSKQGGLNKNFLYRTCLFKVNNKGDETSKKMCKTWSKLIDVIEMIQVSLLLVLNRFHKLFRCFHC